MPRSSETKEIMRVLAWVLAWLLVAEISVRILWRPSIVGRATVEKTSADYTYGFDESEPLCSLDSGQYFCFPTQYRKFTSTDFAEEAAPGVHRFITVGGSHAAGADSYTKYAADALAQRCPASDWEGVNLALRGIGAQRILMAAREALNYQPEILVLDFGGTNEYEDERDQAERDAVNRGVWAVVFQSQLVVLGRKLLSRRLRLPNEADSSRPSEAEAGERRDVQERWQASIAGHYSEILSLAHSKGVRVVVVGRAFIAPLQEVPYGAERRAMFLAMGEEEGVSTVDVHKLFKRTLKRNPDRTLFSGDRTHYSDDGKQLIGGRLARALKQLDAGCTTSSR